MMGGGGQVHPKCKNSMAMSGVGLGWRLVLRLWDADDVIKHATR